MRVSDTQSFYYADFIDMMNQQTRLQPLTIDGVTSNNCNIFSYDGLLRCQLTMLTIQNCNITHLDEMRNLIQLIKGQKNLKVLKILNTPIPSSVDITFTYKQIFGNCIRESHLDIEELSFFHSHHFTNRSLRNLAMKCQLRS